MHEMSPLRLQYGKRSSRREAYACIYAVHKRTGLCEYEKMGGVAAKMRGFLVTGTYNRQWREMEIQRVCRRERGN